MELRKFIANALVDIVEGIKAAQDKTSSGTVAPSWIADHYKAIESGVSRVQPIDFEVTVKADESKGSSAKISVVAAVVGGGVKGESGEKSGSVATLKFRIPILLPGSDRTDDAEQK